MPDDRDPRTGGPRIVRTPDQLQQSKRHETPRPGAAGALQDGDRGAEPRDEGVLGQLRTERAHD